MVKKITGYFAVAMFLGAVFTGCNGGTAQNTADDYEMAERITTRTPMDRGYMLNRDRVDDLDNNLLDNDRLNTNLNAGIDNFGTSPRRTAAVVEQEDRCQSRLNDLATVNNSEVIIRGDVAYVACDLNRDARGVNLQNLRNTVLNTIKDVKPSVNKCYVMTADSDYNQVKVLARDIRANNSYDNYIKNLNDLVIDVDPINVAY